MIRILAVDTSTGWGSVALLECRTDPPGAVVVAELGARVRGSQSEHLLGWIEQALAAADWSKSSLDAFVATRGPGTFTGIRVGLGTCRGLGLAADRPCFGVDTLEAIAQAHGPAGRERVPFLGAGRGELYLAHYDAAGAPPVARRAAWIGEAQATLSEHAAAGRLLIPGPDAPVALELPACSLAAVPRSIAAAAGQVVAARAPVDPEALTPVPLYVRPPDALLGRKRS